MNKLSILGEEAKIEIEFLERPQPELLGAQAGDWVRTTISVEIPGYSAFFQADLRTDEFSGFRDQLATMYENLKGEATLVTIESSIIAKAAMDSRGSIFWDIETRYPIRESAILAFKFKSDQSYLNRLIKELEKVLTEFPVLERKNKKKSHLNDFMKKMRGAEKI